MSSTKIHHINCGTLFVPNYPTVVCHCLLLEDTNGLALVDTGIGFLDVKDPVARLGEELIDAAGFQFNEFDTAVRRVEQLGFNPSDVEHIILTHCDPDHAGGLADFPNAEIHISNEELVNLYSGNSRYVARQFEHGPKWKAYNRESNDRTGWAARRLELSFAAEVFLVPLFGHTLGHCGVVIIQNDRWVLHVGDAYYLRAELDLKKHPVSEMAAQRADHNGWRLLSIDKLRSLQTCKGFNDQVEMFGYHDFTELPVEVRSQLPIVQSENLA